MVSEIEKIVKEACESENNVHGVYAWSHHIAWVVSGAKKLAKKLNADEEIVEIAALLHDYAGIINQNWVEVHEVEGARLAREILEQYDYPEDRVRQVAACILAHRGSQNVEKKTVEEQILASADAMAHIFNVHELLHYAYVFKKMDPDVGAVWVKRKTERSWNKLMPAAKEMARERYEAIQVLLKIEEFNE